MSAKNVDKKGRWRNISVSFRVSPEEDKQIERLVSLCGMTKQDYIIDRLTGREIVVDGNPRVYKALRNQFVEVLNELKRINNGSTVDDELLDTIQMISRIMEGMQNVNDK